MYKEPCNITTNQSKYIKTTVETQWLALFWLLASRLMRKRWRGTLIETGLDSMS